jgi:hypothetical protein
MADATNKRGLLLSGNDWIRKNCRAGASPAKEIARQPGTVALQETAIAMFHGLVPIFTNYRVVLKWE